LEITIRKARVEDLVSINELTDAMHRDLASLYRLELPAKEIEEEHFDEDELDSVYVAEIKGAVVAYMSFCRGEDEWTGRHYGLEHIVVREDHRKSGIATRLFEVLRERAICESVNITTGTLTRNEPALRLYEKLGFKPLTVGLLLDLQKRIPDR